MDTAIWIFQIILSIGFLIFLAYLWGLFTDWLAKKSNSNISYKGQIISRPDDHDRNMKSIADAKQKLITNSKKLIEKIKSNSVEKITAAEKIKALKDLEELKNQNAITIEEYNSLKSDLL
ncbi:hypothetical protein [uncultured Kordia sp.]|uniref:hypothetical protein n=1 Tax=uncultured Kordia sp. TaxID=507699 RepID=UPI00261ED0E4|nr:hypothetical protein [uncultured Kordia sp.]